MKDNIKLRKFYVKPQLPAKLEPLNELSQNIWSTWDTDAYRLFSRIDPNLFRQSNHNPVKLLQIVSAKRLEELAQDKGFLYEMKSVQKNFRNYLSFVGQYTDEKDRKHDFPEDFRVAYLSMEFGLHESLSIYSGGLGVLSGDHLKAASDLGLPLIAFGLLYRYGYFSQKINLDGLQEEIYEENEWYSKPIEKLKDEEDQDLVLEIRVKGEAIKLKAWRINVGKIPLYLLDSNLLENSPKYRHITDYLYDAVTDTRILQEIVLAYGSIELLRKLQIKPSVFHLNEGHSAFLIIKRLKDLITEENFSYDEACELVRATTVFTTHTPVPAGNEKFDAKLIESYLGDEIRACGQDFNEFAQLARIKGDDAFSLPALAIRFSRHINGVSQLHSRVSQEMWHSIYPEVYEEEMPIQAITNGVHLQTWLSRRIIRLLDRYIGDEYRHRAEDPEIWRNVLSIPDTEVWEAHQTRKEQMISFMRNRLRQTLLHRGSSDSITKLSNVLQPDHLIIGFARRFATYKRGNLILRDKERLLKIINNPEQPVQFIFAGKAHPADSKGKAMIQEIIDFARLNHIEDKFIFIEDYDMNIARHLVQGCDVWLNTPVKPLEASGTSGMKAGMNGALNLSVLDGWWPECFSGYNGWAIDAGESVADPELRDRLEANEIYDILENEIVPLYYTRDQSGLPLDWIEKMRFSIYDVGKGFNIHRMLREYIDKFYIPGSLNGFRLKENEYENLHKLIDINNQIKSFWDRIRINDFQVNVYENKIIQNQEDLRFQATIDLDGAPAELIRVEVFYKYGPEHFELIPLDLVQKENNLGIFRGEHAVLGAGMQGFNLRIRPAPCCFKDFYDRIKWYY
ncbi:MAG: alpha-glucan family phosphorylase [Candidatus Cloacimonetes bacterium]|nr:alpha-glucan family phosphorylase [Candidatus Cloacimonadota bacterium]